MSSNFAVVIMAAGPGDRIPLVIERSKPTPHYWKFPGGSSEPGETPEQAAARELAEETGLRLDPSQFVLVWIEDLGSHQKLYFYVQTPDFDQIKRHGDEGEEVGLFPLSDVLSGKLPILPHHRTFAEHMHMLAQGGESSDMDAVGAVSRERTALSLILPSFGYIPAAPFYFRSNLLAWLHSCPGCRHLFLDYCDYEKI